MTEARAAARTADYLPIAAYGIIGDCHTAALVGTDGSIDWFCPERFDSPAVFCRLLDARLGGYLSVTPAGRFDAQRRYREGTNILETTFTAGGDQARLTDFMPLRERTPGEAPGRGSSGRICRLVEALAGAPTLTVRFKPTFAYAETPARLAQRAGGLLATPADGPAESLALACPELDWQAGADGAWQADLHLAAGERLWLVLAHVRAGDDPDKGLAALAALAAHATRDAVDLLAATARYWQDWSDRCTYHGPYRAEVLRSALALKLLTYAPSGAIVAAPTTSLPEHVGGVRNWDYRYTWLRDASLLLYALLTLNYHAEATDFFAWLRRTQEADPTALPQIMYTVDERRDLPERTLDYLSGYRDSRPVRVGNAASRQLQLDIFGEVLTAADLRFGKPSDDLPEGWWPAEPPGRLTWSVLRGLVEQAAERWQEPDEGIWEVRGGPQRFLYSRLMCWAAIDRGLHLAEAYRLPAPTDVWSKARAAIRNAILTEGYNAKVGAFTQALGSSTLDASALVIPRLGFLPPTDPRVRSTIERIRADLTQDGLVYRYRAADGLPGGEGAFFPCSFWLAEAEGLGGWLERAHDQFAGLLRRANDLGLFSEEIDPATGALLGNFPQGFSHAALINAAVNLAKAGVHGPEHAPETQAERAPRAHRAARAGRGSGGWQAEITQSTHGEE